MICHDELFHTSARFATRPFFPAQWSPTNRQLAGEAQETSFAKTLGPCDRLGTDSAVQIPPLCNGISPNASQAFTATVDQAPAFTSARSVTFRAGRLRKFTFRTTGFPAATLSERGRLPSGVRFKRQSGGTALLEGRASRADRGKTYVITVIARNGVGAAVRETFRLKVS
jgi:hypothetical protein